MTLFHCTDSVAAVANILEHGFAYVALPTKVSDDVLPDLPTLDREPQQFGMICFRYESEVSISVRHRTEYGEFAICVDPDWAIAAGANPVIYVRKGGPVALAFKRLLKAARKAIDVEVARFPEDKCRLMMFNNSGMAGTLGAPEWSDLISIYQYMAPAGDQWENEWRIVNSIPNYSIGKSSSEAIPQVSPPQGWAKTEFVVKPPLEAILHLVAPRDHHKLLRKSIPEPFSDIEIKD